MGNIDFICNNCNAGIILHDLNLKFNTPTVNMYFEGTDFYGILLNQPNQDLGVNVGDRVKFHLTKDKEDKIFCFCDLDNDLSD